MVMIMVNIYDAKARLSEFLEAAASGERVVICKHNQPVAELRAIEAASTTPRDLTPMYAGSTFTTEAFFTPLTPDELATWAGAGTDVPKVAEGRAEYSPLPKRRTRKRRR